MMTSVMLNNAPKEMLPDPEMVMVTEIELFFPPSVGSYYGILVGYAMTLAEIIDVAYDEKLWRWDIVVEAINPSLFATMANHYGWKNEF